MNLNKNGELSALLQHLTDKYGRAWPRLVPDGSDGGSVDPDLAEIWRITGGKPPKKRTSNNTPQITPPMVEALRQAINDVPSSAQLKNHTGLTENQILTIFYRYPDLEAKYYRNKYLYSEIFIGDVQENRVYKFHTIAEAARWLKIDRKIIVNTLRYRHGGGSIKRRYRVKRHLWFDIDGGFD